MTTYLCALLPPSNIAAEVSCVQRSLFTAHGLCSALALPALVPVSFHDRLPDAGTLDRVVEVLGRIQPFVIGQYTVVGDSLFLDLETANQWEAIRSVMSGLPQGTVTAGGIIPLHEGLFVSCLEGSVESSALRAGLGEFGLRRFSTFRVVFLRILTHSTPWWDHVQWMIPFERRLKRADHRDRSSPDG